MREKERERVGFITNVLGAGGFNGARTGNFAILMRGSSKSFHSEQYKVLFPDSAQPDILPGSPSLMSVQSS